MTFSFWGVINVHYIYLALYWNYSVLHLTNLNHLASGKTMSAPKMAKKTPSTNDLKCLLYIPPGLSKRNCRDFSVSLWTGFTHVSSFFAQAAVSQSDLMDRKQLVQLSSVVVQNKGFVTDSSFQYITKVYTAWWFSSSILAGHKWNVFFDYTDRFLII